MIKPLHRSSILLAILSGTLALTLLLLALATHGSQGMFQLNRPVAEYSALLIARAAELRLDLAIDFLYLCSYAAFFVMLVPTLRSFQRDTTEKSVPFSGSSIWLGALLLTALLDAAENAHILSMLTATEKGLPLTSDGITWQVAESQLKFVSSYFGLFLLSFYLPTESFVEKCFVFILRWVQAPIGVAIFVLSAEIVKPFFLARALFFVFGFWTMAWIIYRRSITQMNVATPPFPLGSHT
ncbi:MAG: hypothetical protein ACXU8A_05385 [Burkholderiaceae bacterium]